jgi:hypothetical protein
VRHTARTSVIAFALAMASSLPARTAECRANLEVSGAVAMIDDGGTEYVVRLGDNGTIVHESRFKTGQAVTTTRTESLEGLFPTAFRSLGPSSRIEKLVDYVDGGQGRIAKFFPLRLGTSLAIDVKGTTTISTGAPTTPGRTMTSHVQTDVKVTGAEDFAVGTCTYPTMIVELASRAQEQELESTKMHYVLALKHWLKVWRVTKVDGQPDVISNRKIVTVSVLEKQKAAKEVPIPKR